MDQVSLPVDLEQFAAEVVASGRYRDAADVVRAALTLLRDTEAEMAAFVATLDAANLEGERDGLLTAETVERRVRASLAATALR